MGAVIRRVIRSYTLKAPREITDPIAVEMRQGATVIRVGTIAEDLVVWAIEDPECKIVITRRFRIFMDNRVYEDGGDLRYIGTVVVAGKMVFTGHLFEQG